MGEGTAGTARKACYGGEMLTTWILALLLHVAPPERLAALPQLPGWAETSAAKRARYEAIAADIASAVYMTPEQHQRQAAALLVAIASHESGFAPDVDAGRCYRGPGWRSRCDGGRAVSLWQLQGRPELAGDRAGAARAALSLATRSIRACSSKGPDAGLRLYASGSCQRGQPESAAMLQLARRLRAIPRPLPIKMPVDSTG